MKIPFKLLPASWGLKGKTREIAEAEYYFEGEELDRKLADINHAEGKDREVAHLAIDLRYNHIDILEHDEKYAELTMSKDSNEYKLEMARINHAKGKFSDSEYKKEVATIKEEPYIEILNINSKNNSFEFDWNEYFIKDLEEAGFGPAPKQEMIVEEWFNALCKDVALEAFRGDGALDDLEEQEKDRKANLVEVEKLDNERKVIR